MSKEQLIREFCETCPVQTLDERQVIEGSDSLNALRTVVTKIERSRTELLNHAQNTDVSTLPDAFEQTEESFMVSLNELHDEVISETEDNVGLLKLDMNEDRILAKDYDTDVQIAIGRCCTRLLTRACPLTKL